jgi:hypothetical protein
VVCAIGRTDVVAVALAADVAAADVADAIGEDADDDETTPADTTADDEERAAAPPADATGEPGLPFAVTAIAPASATVAPTLRPAAMRRPCRAWWASAVPTVRRWLMVTPFDCATRITIGPAPEPVVKRGHEVAKKRITAVLAALKGRVGCWAHGAPRATRSGPRSS